MQPPYSPLTPFENLATNTPYAALIDAILRSSHRDSWLHFSPRNYLLLQPTQITMNTSKF